MTHMTTDESPASCCFSSLDASRDEIGRAAGGLIGEGEGDSERELLAASDEIMSSKLRTSGPHHIVPLFFRTSKCLHMSLKASDAQYTHSRLETLIFSATSEIELPIHIQQ